MEVWNGIEKLSIILSGVSHKYIQIQIQMEPPPVKVYQGVCSWQCMYCFLLSFWKRCSVQWRTVAAEPTQSDLATEWHWKTYEGHCFVVSFLLFLGGDAEIGMCLSVVITAKVAKGMYGGVDKQEIAVSSTRINMACSGARGYLLADCVVVVSLHCISENRTV